MEVKINATYNLNNQVAGRGFLNTWIAVFKNFSAIRPCDAALGFSCIGILLFLRVSV
jgi:hypothetical protein